MPRLIHLLLVSGLLSVVLAAQSHDLSFVVLGHLRGDPSGDVHRNPLIDELVEDCRGLEPDLAFLTGDAIWGDYHSHPTRPEKVREEWRILDENLKRIGAPIHRVPGNHDVNDLITKAIFDESYGALPRSFRMKRCLFILLNSAWQPKDANDKRKAPTVHGQPILGSQLKFLENELKDPTSYDHAFVFVHHVLWWADSSAWWRTAHPLLKGKKVRAVFAGDYGPMKFSHIPRDGIDYVQAAIETDPSIDILRSDEKARVLSAQMDSYLHVVVTKAKAEIRLRPVGAFRSGRWTPAKWREINDLSARDYIKHNVLETTKKKRKLAQLLFGVGFGSCLLLWILSAWFFWRRRRRRTAKAE